MGNKKKTKSGKQVSKVSSFKKRQAKGSIIELPSGEVCRAVRVGMKVFLKAGVVPSYLSATVERMVQERQTMGPPDMRKLAGDPTALLKTEELLDRALCMTVIEPAVIMPPGCAFLSGNVICGKWLDYNDKDIHNHESEFYDHDYIKPERDDEILYADEVDLADKLYLFNWSVGGGADLETFRKQLAESMESVQALQQDVVSAIGPDGPGT